MSRVLGIKSLLPSDYLNATATVSLLSVVVLIFLFLYLNWYTGRRYFTVWTSGWVFYAAWLAVGPDLANASPFQVMLKHSCLGLSAALLFWGSVQFLKLPSHPRLFGLFIGFLLAWSFVGAYFLKNPLEIRAPLFVVIGLASLVTAFSFYRLRKHREYLGAGLLTFGFVLWGLHLALSPFLVRDVAAVGTEYLIAAVLQLFIAVSMIILVLEEARAANEMMLAEIRASHGQATQLGIESVRDDAPSPYHGIFDRSFLSEKLRQAREDLRLAQESSLQRERLQALGQMSRGIAHDINNALTPILGYSNLLLRESAGLPESTVTYLRSIKSAGEKISQSVSCIRDFYRQRDGKDLLLALNLNSLLDELTAESRSLWQQSPRFAAGELEFQATLPSSLPHIMGKPEDLREAVKALFNNAMEALPEGGTFSLRTGLRPASASKSAETRVDNVFLEVTDTGVGMDETTRQRCLEPFFTTKNHSGAKGLGLSRVFGIMQRHQGQIEIESRPGRGTTVRLLFPAVRTSSTEMFYPTNKAAPLPPLNILCIDDEPSILDVLKLVLKDGGHHVEVAPDGQSGLESFRAARTRNQPFDVVVTDFGMPKMDGRRVAAGIKQESAGTPVIMLTGWGGIMQAEGSQPENIDAVLSKPPQVNELIGAIHKVTGR